MAQNIPSTDATPYQAEAKSGTKVRNYAFKGLVVLFTLFLLAIFNLNYITIVLGWLPDSLLLSIRNDLAPADLPHRLHSIFGLTLFIWGMLVGTVIQLFKPEKRLAPLIMALSVPVLLAIGEIITTGVYDVMGTAPFILPLLLITLLHPRRGQFVRIDKVDKLMLGLTLLAAIPWGVWAYNQASFHLAAVPGDTHAEMGHWSWMVSSAMIVVICGLISATDLPGWRLVSWTAGLASLLFGLQSLLFPISASGADTPWAIAAVAWAIAFVILAERRARTQDTSGPEKATA